MTDLARKLCNYLLEMFGDIGLVTPPAFANALRVVAEIPYDASPLRLESWIRQYVDIRIDAAPPSLAGWNYQEGDRGVIETGRGRSVEERNLTIPHEFAERLRLAINDELARRGSQGIDWPDRAWDAMSAELVSPLAAFKKAAQENGVNVVDLAKPLSYEATVRHLGTAFDDALPLFAVYYKNDSTWERGKGFAGNTWIVAQSAWTGRWLAHAYRNRREILNVPRRHAGIRAGSLVDEVRHKGRALLIHASDEIDGRPVETDVLLRSRSYGRTVAQVFAVGVAKAYSHVLQPQLQLVAPDERDAVFATIF